jgi:hypothetical protein
MNFDTYDDIPLNENNLLLYERKKEKKCITIKKLQCICISIGIAIIGYGIFYLIQIQK